MDFSKPIYGEVEGFIDAAAAKEYFKKPWNQIYRTS